MVVHDCISTISRRLFNLQNMGSYQQDIGFTPPRLLKIPFSYRTVYILYHSAGFNNTEIGELLNISSIQVRERLIKAEIYFNDIPKTA
jgi:hypothetical protein